ncbi:MAG TPA: hypothetical protein DEA91_03780 [Paenibacillus sp.]|nr:hypothetical protein [Paenibacillus sp.]
MSLANDVSNFPTIKQGNYEIELSPCLHTKVKASVMMKKLLKQLIGEAPSRDDAEVGNMV